MRLFAKILAPSNPNRTLREVVTLLPKGHKTAGILPQHSVSQNASIAYHPFRKKFGITNLTSLVERVSRLTVQLENACRRSRPIMDGLITSLAPLLAHARRSMSFDRGLEFLAWP
ncbi:hypothetical protein GL300_24055 [Paracoccus litorisediminis]|jgi:ABC-type sugar transport system ATPase subunit|uniref:Transposase n=1 Tax=Paracoccus litorisediminis TaxID=2006130 RepID=A0A844HT49_9RHOB|nr:hypothetical protein [Paracoccus litorisediminis]